jgi:hypothetical protein
MFNPKRLLWIAIVGVVVLTSVLMNNQPASAGGMGGVAVQSVRVCLNGLRFTGTLTDANAANRKMTAKIFHGHVGVPLNLAATGSTRVFTVVGQTQLFAIYYPTNTFQVGEEVTYSVLTSDGSGYGGGQFATVQKCNIRR